MIESMEKDAFSCTIRQMASGSVRKVHLSNLKRVEEHPPGVKTHDADRTILKENETTAETANPDETRTGPIFSEVEDEVYPGD